MSALRQAERLRGLVAVVVIGVGFALGGTGLTVSSVLVGIAVAGELFARARSAGLRPLAPLGLLVIVAMALVGYVKTDHVSRALVGVVGAFVIATFGEMLVRTDRRRLLETVLSSLIPAVFIAIPIAYIAAMSQLPEAKRLTGTLLLVILIAELSVRAFGRLAGTGVGGAATGLSGASFVRLVGALLGAWVAAMISTRLFFPAFDFETAIVLGVVGGLGVGVSQPVVTLLETVSSAGAPSSEMSMTRMTAGLWLSAPFAFYVFLLLAR